MVSKSAKVCVSRVKRKVYLQVVHGIYWIQNKINGEGHISVTRGPRIAVESLGGKEQREMIATLPPHFFFLWSVISTTALLNCHINTSTLFTHSVHPLLCVSITLFFGVRVLHERLLHTISHKPTGYLEFCRNPLCTPFPEIVQLLLASNKVNPTQIYKSSNIPSKQFQFPSLFFLLITYLYSINKCHWMGSKKWI